jgi:hypothetical protein
VRKLPGWSIRRQNTERYRVGFFASHFVPCHLILRLRHPSWPTACQSSRSTWAVMSRTLNLRHQTRGAFTPCRRLLLWP